MGKSKSRKSSMTKKQFIKKLDEYTMSYSEFSKLIGYHYQTVKQWKDGDIPYFVEIVFEYLDMIYAAQKNIEGRTNGTI